MYVIFYIKHLPLFQYISIYISKDYTNTIILMQGFI